MIYSYKTQQFVNQELNSWLIDMRLSKLRHDRLRCVKHKSGANLETKVYSTMFVIYCIPCAGVYIRRCPLHHWTGVIAIS